VAFGPPKHLFGLIQQDRTEPSAIELVAQEPRIVGVAAVPRRPTRSRGAVLARLLHTRPLSDDARRASDEAERREARDHVRRRAGGSTANRPQSVRAKEIDVCRFHILSHIAYDRAARVAG